MTTHRTPPPPARWQDSTATRTVPGASTVRIVVVDDETLTRVGFELILGQEPGIEVVAAVDTAGATAAVAENRPDVVLLDVRMPDLDELAVLRQIRALPDPPQVAMLTTVDNEACVVTALEAGACGFLSKNTSSQDLPLLVRSLASGATVLSPSVGRTVVDGFLRLPRTDLTAARQVQGLTDREREVLTLLARGLTNPDIADRLSLKIGTTKELVRGVLARLGARNRLQAALVAQRAGLVEEF